MIKVEHTKTHPTDKATIGGVVGWIQVTDAELVLVECKPEEALFNLIENGLPNGILRLHIKGKFVAGRYFKPILISRTEQIEVGDWILAEGATKTMIFQAIKVEQPFDKKDGSFNSKVNGKVYINTTDYLALNYCHKILALPEHFNPQQLQNIVDGKLKEGMLVVECENKTIKMDYHGVDSRGDYKWYCPKCGKGGSYMGTGDVHCHESNCIDKVIKLNPHITIYPVEEKMFPLWRVKEFCDTVHYTSFDRGEYEEWFEQNVK